ncbi:MAG: 5-formaminoimidazole-4-carboxamide-1-(beta)-D-ribofuranosyl 5'-monophosphate synthetase [Candidatus Thorarchaeota archaeon]|nr:MAG: 5-formaminoimidazole-4-carboxamide-1-(beta)-D-ribofuranosyl 5'-monophosphate synthetase [Candidatus Thorarchaeota archaeon]
MKIGTIASHSALNIMSGAKSEGFQTVLYCQPKRREFYESFGLKDSIVEVQSFDEILDMDTEDVIIIPHGSFVAYIGAEKILQSDLNLYGNKELLKWEEDRELKSQLMKESGLRVPKEFDSVDDIDTPVIVKTYGAAGGEGYFIAKDRDEARNKMDPNMQYGIQQYVVGTKVFVTYFNSLSRERIEVFGADIRYETDADANLRFDDRPSFVVIGNLPMVLRESTLATYFEMGRNFVSGFEELTGETIPGPFCIETIIDKEQNIYTFEFSGRIVAGTNVWIPYSPYSYLQFGEEMWMGKRIARELKELMESGKLESVFLP